MGWMLNAIFFHSIIWLIVVDLTAFLELSMECKAQQCADVIDIFNQKGICGGTITNRIDGQAPNTHNTTNKNRWARFHVFFFIFCFFILCYSLFTLELHNQKWKRKSNKINDQTISSTVTMQNANKFRFLKNSFRFQFRFLICGIFICIIASWAK